MALAKFAFLLDAETLNFRATSQFRTAFASSPPIFSTMALTLSAIRGDSGSLSLQESVERLNRIKSISSGQCALVYTLFDLLLAGCKSQFHASTGSWSRHTEQTVGPFTEQFPLTRIHGQQRRVCAEI